MEKDGYQGRGHVVIFVIVLLLANLMVLPSSTLGGDDLGTVPEQALLDPPVEKPGSLGPVPTGWTYDTINLISKGITVRARAYYPATASQEDATTNTSDAPYPVMFFAPGSGGNEDNYVGMGRIAASWGVVFIVIGFDWGLGGSGNVNDYRDVVDHYIAANASAGHILYQMLDSEKFCSGGHSQGGRTSVTVTPYIPEFKLFVGLSPALPQSEVDAIENDFTVPIQLHTGTDDPFPGHGYLYNTLDVVRETITVVDGGHSGPFDWGIGVAFMLYYLNGDNRYEYWVYKAGMMQDIASEDCTVKYDRLDGRFFPPELNATSSNFDVMEDEELTLEVTLDGYYDPTFGNEQFYWDLDDDKAGDRFGADPENIIVSFNQSSSYQPVVYYSLGDVVVSSYKIPTPISVTNQIPIAHGKADAYEVLEDVIVNFDADGSTDTPSDMDSLEFRFEFRDGTSRDWSTDPSANHSYGDPGIKEVRMKVRDDNGAMDTAIVNITVINVPPGVVEIPDIEAWEDETIMFTSQGTDTLSDVGSLLYMWDLGDGNGTTWSQNNWTEHAYPKMGGFTVTSTVKDDDGETASIDIKVTIRNAVPTAEILMPLPFSFFNEDDVVFFSGEGVDNESDLPTLEYSWDFGDGATSEWSSGPTEGHVYTTSGYFDVVLRIRDDDGDIGSDNMTIEVMNIAPTAEILDKDIPASVEEDEPVHLKGSVEDTPSDMEDLNITWSIEGMGLVLEGLNVTVSFPEEGIYVVVFKVVDDDGEEATDSVKVKVVNVDPRITDAGLNATTIHLGEGIHFSANATDTASDMAMLRYSWDMGDGTVLTSSSGDHTYTRTGTFKVSLTVYDDDAYRRAERSFTVTVKERKIVDPPTPPPPGGNGEKGLSTEMLAGIAVALAIVGLLIGLVVMVSSNSVKRRHDELVNQIAQITQPPQEPPSAHIPLQSWEPPTTQEPPPPTPKPPLPGPPVKYCSTCGAKTETLFCPECGTKVGKAKEIDEDEDLDEMIKKLKE